MRRPLSALGLLTALLWQPLSASAWQTTITDAPGLPPEFVAVDKSSQRLFLLARRSPLTVEEAFPSIHGRVEGDKQVEGDLRTPEGVYFVRGKIQAQLDFDEYGSQAHALNYPNPVDRLRGKTGYGIWIHSKGRPIATQRTQGCIAIDLADIDRLAPRLKPGTPVLVAQRVDGPVLRSASGMDSSGADILNTDASGITASASLPLPTTSPGTPDIAVNTATATQGMSDAAAQFQTKEPRGNAPASLSPAESPTALPAENSVPWVVEAPLSVLPAEMPPQTPVVVSAAEPGALSGKEGSEETATYIGNSPVSSGYAAKTDADDPSGFGVSSDLALPAGNDVSLPALTEGSTETALPEHSNLPVLFDSSTLKSVADEANLREVARLSTEWNNAWADRSAAFFDFYEPDAYTKTSEEFTAFKALKTSLFQRFSWISIEQGEISALPGPGYWVSWFTQYYRAPNLHTEGIRRLYWMPGENGALKIVAMEWLPKELGLHDAFMKRVTPEVLRLVENWREAWEDGDLERYASFYRPGAEQGNLKGLDAILENKKTIWARKKPARVEFQGTIVYVEDRGVRVRMTQLYSDSSGYHDKGIKELLLYPHGDSWRIASESWTIIRNKT